ncbi:MAG: hypothetical protein AB1810_08645 [Pseudomonadota bacterium]
MTCIKTVFLLLLFWIGAVSAEEPASDPIRSAVAAAQIEQRIREMTETIGWGLRQREQEGMALKALSYDELQRVLAKHYDPAQLTGKLIERLRPLYDPNRFTIINSSLNSPQLREYTAKLAARPAAKPSRSQRKHEQREALLDELDRAAAETEWLAGTQALSTLALLHMMQTVNEEAPPGAAQQEAILGQMYAQYLEASRFSIKTRYLEALADVPEDQLRLYIRMLRGSALQWFNREAINALIAVMVEARQGVEAEIAALVAAKKPAKK